MGQFDLMAIDFVSPTLEGVVLNGASGLLAQSFNVYQQRVGYGSNRSARE